MRTSVLKPGYLVSLKTAIKGGVTYTRKDTDPEHRTDAGAVVAAWETSKEIPDPDDYDRAILARTAARSAVGKVCAYSPAFGFLCPLSNEGELDDAIREARRIATEHNATTTGSYLQISVICGRIAQDDAEAARAVGTEMRELMEQIQAGIRKADPALIREAANRAKGMESMLSAEVSGQVSAAIVEAREAARAIVKRVQKSGETAAAVVAELNISRIERARFAFLDLDESAEAESVAPAGRGIDYEPAPAYDDGTGEPEPMPENSQFRAAAAPIRTLELF